MKVIKEIKNDARIGQYAVRALTQPNLGTDRMNKAAFMTQMIMNKALPAVPSVLTKLFDLMEVPGYKEIIDEITNNTKGAPQLTQMVQMLQKMNKVLQGEVMKLAKQNELKDFANKLDHEWLKIKEEVSGARSNLEDTVQQLIKEVNDAGNSDNGSQAQKA
jgi:biopolymer transport protein ExbB/TolQ